MNNTFDYIYQNIFGRGFYDSHTAFSDDLFKESLYFSIGLTTLIVSIFFCISFYYIINRPSFSKWYHWIIVGIINFIVCSAIGYFISYDTLNSLLPDIYPLSDYIGFALLNGVISTAYYIFAMFIFRWWSSNAKTTPFPH